MVDALNIAIERAGGVGALAGLLGVGPSTVSNWRKRGVPLDACGGIERVTGVRCEAFYPGTDWFRNEAGAVTGYRAALRPHPAQEAA